MTRKLFGTDGVRGVAGTFLTAELSLALARTATERVGAAPRVLVIRDTRESGEMLEAALAAGVASGGGHALLGGVLPTPGASLLVRRYGFDLAAGARYTATGKRKTAVARVILKPGTGAYEINGRTLDVFFPRPALQRTIRTALETVGLEEKIDVVAAMHGGGVSAQAGALRHAISKALVDADPNLRSELKRRGFLTRDSRVKERKKAGLKKARKRPQFSKR